ncbi:RNA-directed DNA polymerase, eukaryota [Tanacetum coccineum]
MVRFQRVQKQKSFPPKNDLNSGKDRGQFPDAMNSGNARGSFASVLKGGIKKQPLPNQSKPALVLDDSCLKERDFRSSLMGHVKEVSIIPNLYIILAKEGFDSVKLTYLGGLWVLFEFESLSSMEKFHNHVGLLINSWATNTFSQVASKWGDLVVCEESEEISLSCKHLCLKTKIDEIINESFKIIVKGKVLWIRAKELDAWIPKFLSDNDDSSSDNHSTVLDEGCKLGDYENEIRNVDSDVEQLLQRKKENLPQSKDFDPTHLSGFTLDIHNKNNEEGSNSLKDKEKSSLSKKSFTSHNVEALSQRTKSIPTAGGSILDVMDNLVQVGQTMGYNMDGCLGHKAKKGWIQELCTKHKINFVVLQETKSESIDLFSIKALWGNLTFDHAISPSIGNSGGILCVWDPNLFIKEHVSSSDYFIAVMGLIDLPLGGYSYTWAHKSASKMSKLDRFLISEGLLVLFPQLTSLCLDRHLSDHRPIIMYESNMDYGPTPFRLFHSWLKMDGFDKFVEDTWCTRNIKDLNGLIRMQKKLQFLKNAIKPWVKDNRKKINEAKTSIQCKLIDVDKIIDQGGGNEEVLNQRASLMKDLNDINSSDVLDLSQKAKVRWSIEGDENSKYFHRILNSKRSQLAICGILEGDWIVDPKRVKSEFYNHFVNQFSKPMSPQVNLEFQFPKRLNYEQYWNIVDQDIVGAVLEFFASSKFPPSGNSTFIALILKTHDAKVVKDFRQ